MSTVRVLAGLGGVLGAGVFIALGPAAAVSGSWLPLGVLLAALLAALAACSGPARSPIVAASAGMLARVGAAAAVAGTCGLYLTPGSPLVGALGLLVAVAAVEYLVGELPVLVRRVAVGLVVGVLVVFVASCYALSAPANQPVPDGLPGADSSTGVLAAGGLLVVAFGGAPTRGRLAVLGSAAVLTAAVSAAAIHQLGGGRLAISGVPLRDALAAAAGSQIDGLLTAGVTVGCALVLHHVLRDARTDLAGVLRHRAGVPVVVLVPGAALVVVLGPASVLAVCAAGLLLCWMGEHLAVLRYPARQPWHRLVVAGVGLLGCAAALLALPGPVLLGVMLSTAVLALLAAGMVRR